jgi:tripartite-type tricarboxylate transporter receptor subunit TctC
MNSRRGYGAIAGAGVTALLTAAASAAFGQAYPTRPIEVTVHTSAGSGGDVLSRAVAEIVRRDKLLPQPMQVVNRVGGSGALGFNFFKGKRGDPYHLLSVTGTIFAMAYRPDINIGLENYAPVALMAIDPQTIMVPANSPYKTAKELMEAARKAPETLVAATTSVQGTGRLLVYLLEQAVPGAKFRFVTFKGGSDAITSTAGGHTAFTTENLSEGVGFVEARTLRVLAVSSEKRLPHAPDVPTLQELGYPITAGTIRGFTFAAGVPKEAVTTMEKALEQVHKSAAWKEISKRNLYEDAFLGSAEFTKYLAVRYKEYSAFYDVVLKVKEPENK